MIKSTKKGFTLVELIVVIVILAVLATIAFITLQDYPIQARDTKRISEVGVLADKINIVTADGKTKLKDILANSGANTFSITKGTETYSGSVGNIDYKKIKESEGSFKDPVSSKPYKFLYVTGGTGSGYVNCFEVGSFSEKENKNIFKGTCSSYELGANADTHLFSKNYDLSVQITNGN